MILRAVFPESAKHASARDVRDRAAAGGRCGQTSLLVPQQGVTHDPKGNATALVVNADNKVELRFITRPTGRIGDKWLVTVRPGSRRPRHRRRRPKSHARRHGESDRNGLPRQAHPPPSTARTPINPPRCCPAFSSTAPSSPGCSPSFFMLAGSLAIKTLPVAQYPPIAPPAVALTVAYPGAPRRRRCRARSSR